MNSRGEARPPGGKAGSPPNFDRLAPFYRWMEALSFGPWLWWCRCAFLLEMFQARRALTFGDGDGRFTARLLRENPAIEVSAVDASPAMLATLRRRARRNAARLRTEVADARTWTPSDMDSGSYDLVYTHFFLDCLTEDDIRRLAERVRPLIASTGIWVVSEFAIPEGWTGSIVARPLVSFLYGAFGLLTGLSVRCLPDHGLALRQTGFDLRQRRAWLMGLLVSEVWEVSGRAAT
jgi:SAM-dependent methyltransferase